MDRHSGFGRRIGAKGSALLVLVLIGCDSDSGVDPGLSPAPPRNVEGVYYDRAVHLTWELDSQWNGEFFRVFGRGPQDPAFLFLADVTSCSGGTCYYRDTNISGGRTYQYYVSAVGPAGETPSVDAVSVQVPDPVPPPVPGGVEAVALDGAVYLRWDDRSREADDFAFYRVYFDEGVLMGETDSEGFLDLLVQNGGTYSYFITAVDGWGHESAGSPAVQATPRPDFHGELLFAFGDRPAESGFQFQSSEQSNPIVDGAASDRHFRLEVDGEGWWLVPGPAVERHAEAFFTTALRCGPGADAGCQDVVEAPPSNYLGSAIQLVPGFAYVLRVPAGGGAWRYGLVRVTHIGTTQEGAIALFDWAYQLQPDNPSLVVNGR